MSTVPCGFKYLESCSIIFSFSFSSSWVGCSRCPLQVCVCFFPLSHAALFVAELHLAALDKVLSFLPSSSLLCNLYPSVMTFNVRVNHPIAFQLSTLDHNCWRLSNSSTLLPHEILFLFLITFCNDSIACLTSVCWRTWKTTWDKQKLLSVFSSLLSNRCQFTTWEACTPCV